MHLSSKDLTVFTTRRGTRQNHVLRRSMVVVHVAGVLVGSMTTVVELH
uniref:Uncharacterized protein n=1 Tax=Triticum urartu TaxID=4572 RepID=A0A8R7USP1_TRIUA